MSEPKIYRKKPIVIEAMQWDGSNIADLWEWVTAEFLYGPIPAEPAYGPDADGKGCDAQPARPAGLYVAANDVWVNIEIGEWIIRDSLGFYPCKPSIFDTTYEEVKHTLSPEVTT